MPVHRRSEIVVPLIFVVAWLAQSPALDAASTEPTKPSVAFAQVHTVLRTSCGGCHGTDKPKGGLDLGRLDPDLIAGKDQEHWQEVLDAINSGQMPPRGKPQLDDAQRTIVVDWLTRELRRSAEARPVPQVMRRMNVTEYRNSMQELIGIPYDPTIYFSQDPRTAGFDTVGEGLVTSPYHIESWLEAAEAMLSRALIAENTPEPVRQHWQITDLDWRNQRIENRKKKDKDWVPWRKSPGVAIQPGPIAGVPQLSEVTLGENSNLLPLAQPIRDLIANRSWDASDRLAVWSSPLGISIKGEEGIEKVRKLAFAYGQHPAGIYRVRVVVSGSATRPELSPPSLRIRLYPEGNTIDAVTLGKIPQTLEYLVWRDDWKASAAFGRKGWGMDFVFRTDLVGDHVPNARKVVIEDNVKEVRFHSLEIEGPIFDQWPPRSHRDLLSGTSDEQVADSLRRLAERAWRRPVTGDELAPALGLYSERRKLGQAVIPAARTAMALILASPQFLFLTERGPSGTLTDHELAARLSYFLWSSPPDGELRKLADAGQLSTPTVLLAQAKRMLGDGRVLIGLGRAFPMQWLRLHELSGVNPDSTLYPEYDPGLANAMVGETLEFFREVLAGRAPLTAFIESDFALLNERIAHHYGIPGVEGAAFRRVALKPEWKRGGLLTQASILTLTANGTRTLPVHRGVFVLEEILNDPPPPPPPNAGQLDAVKSLRENATVRERLEAHRTMPACVSCHARIDPYGYALESYGATGELRSRERVIVSIPPLDRKTGKPLILVDLGSKYAVPESAVDGNAVETDAVLPNGKKIAGIEDLKRCLLADSDRLAECLAHKLLTYAIGRQPTFLDRPLISDLRNDCRRQGYSLPALVLAVIASPPFRQRGPADTGPGRK
ncbi:hypothetical protein LBMAG53_20860 [Planctomycetota bacterium]|nr:hypothetical protein LBMAG53_20860 [Planctomycetota bacterium]